MILNWTADSYSTPCRWVLRLLPHVQRTLAHSQSIVFFLCFAAPQYSSAEQHWMEFPFYLLIVSWISLFDFFLFPWNSIPMTASRNYIDRVSTYTSALSWMKALTFTSTVVQRLLLSTVSNLQFVLHSSESNTEIDGIKCPFRFCSLRWW